MPPDRATHSPPTGGHTLGKAVARTRACARGAGAGGASAPPRQPHHASRSGIAVRRAVNARSLTRHAAAQPVRFLAPP
eukprot:139102-Chlamydomonas_euryale.AAC.2